MNACCCILLDTVLGKLAFPVQLLFLSCSLFSPHFRLRNQGLTHFKRVDVCRLFRIEHHCHLMTDYCQSELITFDQHFLDLKAWQGLAFCFLFRLLRPHLSARSLHQSKERTFRVSLWVLQKTCPCLARVFGSAYDIL